MIKIAIFILAIVTTGANGDSNDGFRNFITAQMLEFDSWIANEGLDPTPPKDKIFNMSLSNSLFELNGTLR